MGCGSSSSVPPGRGRVSIAGGVGGSPVAALPPVEREDASDLSAPRTARRRRKKKRRSEIPTVRASPRVQGQGQGPSREGGSLSRSPSPIRRRPAGGAQSLNSRGSLRGLGSLAGSHASSALSCRTPSTPSGPLSAHSSVDENVWDLEEEFDYRDPLGQFELKVWMLNGQQYKDTGDGLPPDPEARAVGELSQHNLLVHRKSHLKKKEEEEEEKVVVGMPRSCTTPEQDLSQVVASIGGSGSRHDKVSRWLRQGDREREQTPQPLPEHEEWEVAEGDAAERIGSGSSSVQ